MFLYLAATVILDFACFPTFKKGPKTEMGRWVYRWRDGELSPTVSRAKPVIQLIKAYYIVIPQRKTGGKTASDFTTYPVKLKTVLPAELNLFQKESQVV